MGVYIGVGSYKAGWLAVSLGTDDRLEYAVFPSISKLWAHYQPLSPDYILVNLPIGLPENGQRRCDVEARQLLGKRGNSVFLVPPRAAVYASAYAEGSQINRLMGGKLFAKQLWSIAPKIRELDALLRADPHARETFKETHPELIYWSLGGQKATAYPAKSNNGAQERLALLASYYPNAAAAVDEAKKSFKSQKIPREVLIDTLTAAVALRLDTLFTLPTKPDYDARGLPMQIVYARSPHIIRLHHVQITIPTGTETDARQFYCTLLGLTEIAKPDALANRGGFWLQLGSIEVHIGVEDDFDRNTTKAHLAYQVGDLNYWRKHLEAHDIALTESIPIPGYARFEFRDPFGNRIELIQAQ